MFILFIQLIRFLIKHVHIVIKTLVLLLCFDECRDYLLNVLNTGCILYLIKSVLYNLWVSHVLIQELFLFTICLDYLAKSKLQDSYRIWEFCLGPRTTSFWVIYGLVETFIIKFNRLVSFFQAFLEFLNLHFKTLFFLFMFCLQGQNLIVSFFCLLGSLYVAFIAS